MRLLILAFFSIAGLAYAQPPALWSGRGCTSSHCHGGIEPIRAPKSGMFQRIAERGRAAGDPDGCVVCHGGNPRAKVASLAHRGTPDSLKRLGGPDGFFADPASPWVNARTCGQCHPKLVRVQWNSLMMTEAGKIQGTAWAFGSREGYEHRWSNYDGENPKDPAARLGTGAYRKYMAAKAAAFPNIWVQKQTTMPAAPRTDELEKLNDDPGRAAFTYLRAECERCHLAVKGRARRGDYRGMGCAACHIPYSNEGLYEGGDRTIPHDRPSHMLVHSIQATADSPLRVGKITYSGIPVETCTTCHNRGKRIGVTYQGLMESAWDSPYTEGGGGQIALHSKHYIAMTKDVHYRKGMLCQDCHTSSDVHGDGFIGGTNLAGVEIECTDCHGTPARYPWELPLGFGDENGPGPATGPPRGVAHSLPEHLKRGKAWPQEDGWILTARGNPMPETVRRGEQVVLHTAGGKELVLDPLKTMLKKGSISLAGRVAMVGIGQHIQKMECYTCHAAWAPQCYGCHVKVDYSKGQRSFDWVAAGHAHDTPEGRALPDETKFDKTIPGKVSELRSYMRWEDPVLGMNGEGRVSPLIPGCQVAVTVIGADGKAIVTNHLFRTLPYSEGGGAEGQIGSDMSPVQPHTIGQPRTCESCHGSLKAAGYGIGGGRFNAPWDKATTVDLSTALGVVIPRSARVQIEAIPGLVRDWSAVLTRDGKQTQTVGHHFPGSGPLPESMRTLLDRRNVCIGCHQEIPTKSLAVSLLHHVAEVSGMIPEQNRLHRGLLHKILLTAAWAQVGGAILLLLAALAAILIYRRRRHSVGR